MEQNSLSTPGMRLLGALLALAPFGLAAEEEDAVVVTATRAPRPSLEIPASVDRLYGEEIREGRAQVNLSESLGRVPGIVVQNRQNYAQDLQISSRGFGARATFGVRGIRLIADGIPATMPDGQGQAATFALGSAERIEVLRGPFSALYGNAAGGVIAVETRDGPEVPAGEASLSLGSYDTWRAGVQYGGQWGRTNAIADLSRFRTDGYREHSAARRDHLNAKFTFQLQEETRLTVVANSLRQNHSVNSAGGTLSALIRKVQIFGLHLVPLEVREDAQALYGFLARDERLTFQSLIAAHGVGPALAMHPVTRSRGPVAPVRRRHPECIRSRPPAVPGSRGASGPHRHGDDLRGCLEVQLAGHAEA